MVQLFNHNSHEGPTFDLNFTSFLDVFIWLTCWCCFLVNFACNRRLIFERFSHPFCQLLWIAITLSSSWKLQKAFWESSSRADKLSTKHTRIRPTACILFQQRSSEVHFDACFINNFRKLYFCSKQFHFNSLKHHRMDFFRCFLFALAVRQEFDRAHNSTYVLLNFHYLSTAWRSQMLSVPQNWNRTRHLTATFCNHSCLWYHVPRKLYLRLWDAEWISLKWSLTTCCLSLTYRRFWK